MAAPVSARRAHEVHRTVLQLLLPLRDRADTHQELDGEGIHLWLDNELEALHYGVDPDISREELAVLIEGSTVMLSCEEHRTGHESEYMR